jgi:hypothetical protein
MPPIESCVVPASRISRERERDKRLPRNFQKYLTMYLDLNGKGNRNEIRKQIRTGASLDPLTLRFKALLAVHDWPHEVVLQPDLRGDKYKQPRERESAERQ